jgi:hypothetical protein
MVDTNYSWAISYMLPSSPANNTVALAIANASNLATSIRLLLYRQQANSGSTLDTDYPAVTLSIFGN